MVSLDSQGFKKVLSKKSHWRTRGISKKSSLNMVQKGVIFRLVAGAPNFNFAYVKRSEFFKGKSLICDYELFIAAFFSGNHLK